MQRTQSLNLTWLKSLDVSSKVDIVKLTKNLVIMPNFIWDSASRVEFSLFSLFLKQAIYFIFFGHLKSFLIEFIYTSLVES